jgi:hypothetical protein
MGYKPGGQSTSTDLAQLLARRASVRELDVPAKSLAAKILPPGPEKCALLTMMQGSTAVEVSDAKRVCAQGIHGWHVSPQRNRTGRNTGPESWKSKTEALKHSLIKPINVKIQSFESLLQYFETSREEGVPV